MTTLDHRQNGADPTLEFTPANEEPFELSIVAACLQSLLRDPSGFGNQALRSEVIGEIHRPEVQELVALTYSETLEDEVAAKRELENALTVIERGRDYTPNSDQLEPSLPGRNFESHMDAVCHCMNLLAKI